MNKKLKKEQIDIEKAFLIHQNIAHREEQRRILLIDNIIALSEMYDTQAYKAILGFDPPPTWAGYLGQIEVFYSRAEVDMWRRIYHRLGQELGVSMLSLISAPISRLEAITKVAKTKDEAEELLDQAHHVTSRDWKEIMLEKQGKPSMDECKHEMKLYNECKVCGIRHKIDVDQHELGNQKI